MAEPLRPGVRLAGVGYDVELRYPVDARLEAAVLGALLGYRTLRERLAFVRPEHFTNPVARAIVAAVRQNPHADYASLRPWLEQYDAVRAEGGVEVIADCIEAARGLDAEQVLEYARAVTHLALRRDTMREAERLLRAAADLSSNEAPPEIVSDYARRFEKLAGVSSGLDELGWPATVHELAERLTTRRELWPCRFGRLNESWGGGLEPGRVYAFRARPKGGKTLSLTTIGFDLAEMHGLPVRYFLHEMRRDQVAQRIVANRLGINELKLKRLSAEEIAARLMSYAQRSADVPFGMINAPGMSLDGLRAAASEVVNRDGARALCIDYWQLIGGRKAGQSKQEHLEEVAEWMHNFASRYNVVILTAEQENREGHALAGDGLARNSDWIGQLNMREDWYDGHYGQCKALWIDVEYSRLGPTGPVGTRDEPAFAVDVAGPMLRAL